MGHFFLFVGNKWNFNLSSLLLNKTYPFPENTIIQIATMVELYIVHKILELLLCPEIMFLAFLLSILRHKEGLARDVPKS